ncbi:hypothetical protein O181_086169 [Austropuccinia psidii MF-1]|uniref:CCHC-type domain-containing protein n=1 Tax=Austropuccinia psidii MF-1 TaxID=1389203 RepID=A0A9Q3FWM5_9BASI|nr:hypothetical protein [Austropuccinia psidii MF-1]
MARCQSQYQDGDGMSYSEKEALKQLPEASSCPKFSGTEEYDHMELIDYIDGLFIDVPRIPDFWITARLNTAFKDDIANTLQDIRKRANIGKFTPYQSSSFKEKQPFRVEFQDKPRERVAEVAKKKNSCHNCGSTDHYANNCPKAKKKVYAIEKVPEEEPPTEDSESDSMGDAIREPSDDDQDPREEFLVEYKEETPLEIKDIHLEAGMPQDTTNKNLCKHTQDAQTFLVTPTKGMEYILGTATRMTVCIDNAQHPLIIDIGAHCLSQPRVLALLLDGCGNPTWSQLVTSCPLWPIGPLGCFMGVLDPLANPFHYGGFGLNGLFGPFRPPTASTVRTDRGPRSADPILAMDHHGSIFPPWPLATTRSAQQAFPST